MKNKLKNSEQEEDATEYQQWIYLGELEKNYLVSRTKLTDKELLKIFPEAKELLPAKLKEWREVERKLALEIQQRLTKLKQISKNDSDYWFGREWIKLNQGQRLLAVKRQITRVKSLIWISKGRAVRGRLTEEEIYQAKQAPIADLYIGKLRRSGKNLLGLCPFHEEKHASFNIYPNNTCWCFGCQRGGNSINYIILLHHLNFPEAVRYLIRL